jgi:hypothetical protein
MKAHRLYRRGETKAKVQAPSCGRILEHNSLGSRGKSGAQ